jgi:hypothetical protein
MAHEESARNGLTLMLCGFAALCEGIDLQAAGLAALARGNGIRGKQRPAKERAAALGELFLCVAALVPAAQLAADADGDARRRSSSWTYCPS